MYKKLVITYAKLETKNKIDTKKATAGFEPATSALRERRNNHYAMQPFSFVEKIKIL